jgi:hypothetical protein
MDDTSQNDSSVNEDDTSSDDELPPIIPITILTGIIEDDDEDHTKY